ncbi:MAG: creatininase family protein [Candidatus Fervidibacter sp.]|uniref:creatininase family protein n=1 Tax=Candidatus Fervidibacter sp. TaxID=3100871 RepID=UPI0040499707
MERAPRYELMRPDEINSVLQTTPVAYIPWGSLEWHGVQNCIGLDALKAHAICVDAAKRTGGVVLPPVFAGFHTMKPYRGFKHTIEISAETIQRLLREYLEQLCDEGFKVIVVFMGHYGKPHVDAIMQVCEEFNADHPNTTVLAFPEYLVAVDDGVRGDHAGAYETSLMLHYYPETVDLTTLPTGRPLTVEEDGIGGEDPREKSSQQYGRWLAERIVQRLVERVQEALRKIGGDE